MFMRRQYIWLVLIVVSIVLSNSSSLGQGTDYIINGNREVIKEDLTNVTVTKAVEGSTLRYIIKTPKVDDFDFILALDSSGSLGFGGDKDEKQKEAVLNAVPRFLEYTKNNYSGKNFKVSIISWNDKIDFAYGGNFENKDPGNATLVPVEKAINDTNKLFKKYYTPQEDKQTDFSTAIKSSLDILDKNPPVKYNRTLRFIILVTARSEFVRCNKELIDRARNEGYKIYTVGMEVPDESMMRKHLEELSGKDQIKIVEWPEDSSLQSALDELLFKALKETLDKATTSPVAENVRFVESFYSYLKPKSVVVNGTVNRFEIRNNTDNTTTIYFKLAKGLRANTETEVIINSDLDLSNLPVSITKNRKTVTLCTPASSTASSEISYDWLQLKPKIHKDLTENHIDISSRFSENIQNQDGVLRLDALKPITSFLLRVMNSIGYLKADRM